MTNAAHLPVAPSIAVERLDWDVSYPLAGLLRLAALGGVVSTLLAYLP